MSHEESDNDRALREALERFAPIRAMIDDWKDLGCAYLQASDEDLLAGYGVAVNPTPRKDPEP